MAHPVEHPALHWCFTINNPTDEDTFDENLFDYVVVGKETGSSGTPHWQCYGKLKKKARLSWLKKHVNARAHYEQMHGTPQEAADYCKKDGNFVEHGEVPSAQTEAATEKNKTDYRQMLELAKARQVEEIEKLNPRIAFTNYRLIKEIGDDHQPPPKPLTELQVWWIWGPTGTGKTTYCRSRWPDAYWHPVTENNWNGYDGHDTVVFEDVDHLSIRDFKIWCDYYPFPVKQLYRRTVIRPKRMVFTSNNPPEDCFAWTTNVPKERHWPAIRRRITFLVHKEVKDDPVPDVINID